jgi:hypothetical protein
MRYRWEQRSVKSHVAFVNSTSCLPLHASWSILAALLAQSVAVPDPVLSSPYWRRIDLILRRPRHIVRLKFICGKPSVAFRKSVQTKETFSVFGETRLMAPLLRPLPSRYRRPQRSSQL